MYLHTHIENRLLIREQLPTAYLARVLQVAISLHMGASGVVLMLVR